MARIKKTGRQSNGRAKAKKRPVANRSYWTKGEFASYLILVGLGMSKGRAETLAVEKGDRHAYGESNKALVVTPSVRGAFDKAYAQQVEA